MKQRWAAVVVAVALSAFVSQISGAQSSQSKSGGSDKQDQRSGAELGQNSPNPFTTETKIPFTVGDYPTCSDPDRVYRVSLRVFNILSQLVAVPVLQGGADNVADGTSLQNVELTCGQYTAYWDGKHMKTGDDAPPGIYLYRLEVDKKPLTKKMIRSKQ
jgi:hypothetical protein